MKGIELSIEISLELKNPQNLILIILTACRVAVHKQVKAFRTRHCEKEATAQTKDECLLKARRKAFLAERDARTAATNKHITGVGLFVAQNAHVFSAIKTYVRDGSRALWQNNW